MPGSIWGASGKRSGSQVAVFGKFLERQIHLTKKSEKNRVERGLDIKGRGIRRAGLHLTF